MKFLIHGNAPWAPTGYGVQIGHLAKMLRADGHEVACSSTYGLQGGAQNWDGITVYGSQFDYQGNDILHSHAGHYFRREPGWIIICTDVWGIENPLTGFNVAAWVPVDHYSPLGVQQNVAEFFNRTDAVPIAMSQFGEDMLRRRGLDPLYAPLSVNTAVFKPTASVSLDAGMIAARRILDMDRPIPDDAFVVGMVAMNKGWAKDRKGFNEAFRAFGAFDRMHPDANAHLYVHSEFLGGAEGINLRELAVFAGIQEHKVHWGGGPDQYHLKVGFTPDMMAAVYSAIDVLLAPSHGEGFCVPIIEAHACGTPVIATDFAAQAELVPDGTGWLVDGQPEWDPPHHAEYLQPYIADVFAKIVDAWEADRPAMAEKCIAHAAEYDTKRVFETFWKPVIAELIAEPDVLPLDRQPMPDENAVAVLCPVLNRPENVAPLVESFLANTPEGEARLYFLGERDDHAELEAVNALVERDGTCWMSRPDIHTFAEKLNFGLGSTTEPWVLCIGDDVRFHKGWLDQARKLSTEYDVIGTNDTAGAVKNPKVANGSHSDHSFFRRAYVEEYGACLDGPGVLAPECYRHWFVDKEMISLARARGVFSPCLDSVVEHLHPGYEGREDLRQSDSTYMLAVEHSAEDEATFKDRVPLIEMQRTTRARV